MKVTGDKAIYHIKNKGEIWVEDDKGNLLFTSDTVDGAIKAIQWAIDNCCVEEEKED